jgi:hypothetical protein
VALLLQYHLALLPDKYPFGGETYLLLNTIYRQKIRNLVESSSCIQVEVKTMPCPRVANSPEVLGLREDFRSRGIKDAIAARGRSQ